MVWICSECTKYRHDKCESKWSCDCKCNVGNAADVTQKVIAVDGGLALAAGGLALTICTGGLGAVLVGGAMLGAGISSVWQGAEKIIKDERIDGKSYVTDVAVGAVTGLATGGIGAGGEVVATNVVKQGAKVGLQKLAIRTGTGVVAGVASKTIDEVKQCATTDKEWKDFGKNLDENGKEKGTATAWIMGAAVGGLAGAGSHISSNVSKQVSSGVAKAATRVAVSGTTAAVSDVTVQGVNIATGNQDEYNIKQTFTCATTSVVLTAAQEGVKNVVYQANGGKNETLIKKTVPKERLQSAMEGYDDWKKIPQSTLDQEAGKATAYTNSEAAKARHQMTIKNYDSQIQSEINSKNAAIDAKDPTLIRQHQAKMDTLIAEKKSEIKNFQSTKSSIAKSDIGHINKQNAHFLTGDKTGQVAMDAGPNNGNTRGPDRTVFDYHVNDQGRGELRYSGYTSNHDYDTLPGPGKGAYYDTPGRYNNNLYESKNWEYRQDNQASEDEEKKKKKNGKKD